MVTLEWLGHMANRRPGWTGLALFVLAAAPRVLAPAGNFLNVDAAGLWIGRVKMFVLGLQGGGWENLAPSGHPGVTLLWLTSAAEMFWQRWQMWTHFDDPVTAYVQILKMPILIVTSLLVVVVWQFLRRATRPALALLVSIFFALDPLYVIYSRELHLDALLTGFIFAGLAAWWLAIKGKRWQSAAWAGMFMTLAVLTRINGLTAWIFGLVALAIWWPGSLKVYGRLCLAYATSSIATLVVVWPATITAPALVISRLQNTIILGLQPHEAASNVDIIPWVQALLYPIFLLTREFPIFIAAAILGAVVGVIHTHQHWSKSIGGYLLLFGSVFLVMAMIGPKHIDRYFLPGIITVAGLAAYGVEWLAHQAGSKWQSRFFLVLAVSLIFQLGIFWRLQPYYQTYENVFTKLVRLTPLRTSAALTPGWGEGLPQADEFLRRRLGRLPSLASWFPSIHCVYGPAFSPTHYPFPASSTAPCQAKLFFLSHSRRAEYIMITREVIDQNLYPGLQRDIRRLGWQPVEIIRLNQKPYVWVYQNTGGLAEEYARADE